MKKRKPAFLDSVERPVFPVIRTTDGRCLAFFCPSCGKENIHGGGVKFGEGDGSRMSHCPCFKTYSIKEIAPDCPRFKVKGWK